jgi:hypothetical protein
LRRAILATAVVVLLSALPAAQIGYLWSPEELRAKSVVVAIATPVRTIETGVKTELRELKPAFPVIELRTEFKVLSILKGDPAQTTLAVRHYRRDDSRLPGGVINGAHPLSFAEPGSQYLLFLRQDQDQSFIPTSGHVFPNDSVFLLRKAG